MKKIVLSVILSIYFIISLFVTICLLSKNQYNATELFNKVVITSNDIDDKTGKLILINKEKDYKINDEIFYYDSYVPSLKVDSSSIVSIEKITERETFCNLIVSKITNFGQNRKTLCKSAQKHLQKSAKKRSFQQWTIEDFVTIID